MPDADLRSRLSALRSPAASPTARDRALHRATCALAASTHAAPAASATPRRLLPLLLAGAAALALAFALGLRFPRSTSSPTPPPLAHSHPTATDSLRLLAEVQQLFPGRLNAIIERDGSLQIDLAPGAAALVADQPVLVQFTHAGRTVRVLGFSGRHVELDLDGQRLRFAPLLTGQNSVLLAGETFAWQSDQPAPPALQGWRIETRSLADPVL